MSRFLSKRLSSLAAYTPGEQPSDTQYIKLNTNESPYPPSPGVLAALQSGEPVRLNLYPNPDGSGLIEKIAALYNVSCDNVIIGNGSDELLAFSFLAFFENGVVFPDITYGFYPVYANLYGIPYKKIPLNDDFAIDVSNYAGIGMNIVLANPNAPTGIALSLNDIEEITCSNPGSLVLIDEAYVDFGAQSAVALTHKYDNLLVIHTFSKARSMAGLRLAYAIAPAPVINDLNKIKYSFNPYNVDSLAQLLGIAALDEDHYYKEKQNVIIRTRDYSVQRFRELGFTLTDSKANFLFMRHTRIGGRELYFALKNRGILVRHWNLPRIENYIRVTIGTKEQMDAMFSALAEIVM